MATTKATLLGHRSATSFSDLTLSGDLTVNGTTTTLDTAVQNVDKLEIGASSTDYGAKINQASTGHILQLQDNGTDVMVVKDGGNVGIGTTDPDMPIHISSAENNLMHLQSTDQDALFKLSDNGGHFQINTANNNTSLGSNGRGEMLRFSGTSAIVLNEDGLDQDFRVEGDSETHLIYAEGSSDRIGIAQNNPAYRLDVNGTFRATKVLGRGVQESSSGFHNDTFCVEGVNTTNGSTSHGAVFASKHASSYSLICGTHDATFNNFMVRGDGKIFANGLGSEAGHTTLAVRASDGMILKNTSSRRYKSNIVDTTTDSTLINNIQVRDFTWTETGNNYVGLIAEEVNEHLPNAVVKATEDDEVVCESIDWSALTSLLIDYSQKLEQRITALENA